MPRILIIDTIHHPLREKDMQDLKEEIDAADIVIHTFTPFPASVVKGDAEIRDIRQGVRGGWDLMQEEKLASTGNRRMPLT